MLLKRHNFKRRLFLVITTIIAGSLVLMSTTPIATKQLATDNAETNNRDQKIVRNIKPMFAKIEKYNIESEDSKLKEARLSNNLDNNFAPISDESASQMRKLNSNDGSEILMNLKPTDQTMFKEQSKSNELNYQRLDRVRRAYHAALQSQHYVRDMFSRISHSDLNVTLDHPRNLEIGRNLKDFYENLAPYEMKLINQLEEEFLEYKPVIQTKLRILEKKVQTRISELQHLADCKSSRRFYCIMTAQCGLGCLLHHYGTCLMVAMGTNRTLMLIKIISPYKGMETVFQPINSVCTNPTPIDILSAVEYTGELSKNPTPNDIPAVKITISTANWLHTVFAPFTLPEAMADTLQKYHGDPEVWWIGQILKYVVKLQPDVANDIQSLKRKLKFESPIVGIHIRRTDKIQEASYQHLHNYMIHVKRWFDRYDLRTGGKVKRKVFLATDEPEVPTELMKTYVDYEFLLSDNKIFPSTANTRYSKEGLVRAITDVMMLASCDYFVGTYSSNIGRLVYELMQAEGDRTFDSLSIDFAYHYWGSYSRAHEAIENHKPLDGEIELRVGDRLRIRAEKYSLYMGFAENMRTHENGVYPMSKVKPVLVRAPYPGL